MIRTIPVDTNRAPLIATGHVEAVREWIEKDGRRQPSEDQSRDQDTGMPLWTVHVLAVGEDRPEVIAVRVPAREAPAPAAYVSVDFERLVVRVNVNRSSGQLSGYWSAAGIADPATAHRPRQATADAA